MWVSGSHSDSYFGSNKPLFSACTLVYFLWCELTCGPLVRDVIVCVDPVHREVHAHVYWHSGQMVRRAAAAPRGTGREGRGGVVGGGSPPKPLHGVIIGPLYRVSLLPVTGHADLLAISGLRGLTSSHALCTLGAGSRGAWEGLGRGAGPRLSRGREIAAAGVYHHVLQGQQNVGSVFPVVFNFRRAMKLPFDTYSMIIIVRNPMPMVN